MSKDTVHMVRDFYDLLMFGGEHRLTETGQKQRMLHDKIGFFNLGYWKGVEDSIELAQVNLIETLISFFNNKSGNVLDVACGRGASSKFLTKYFEPDAITGINISEKQLEICKLIAPECKFELMDAANLGFEDSSFDNLLCIEAAPHFNTRFKFLTEAHRVLKPQGRLAMSDVFFHNDEIVKMYPHEWPEALWPKENYLPNLEAYKQILSKAGFRHLRVEDITEETMRGYISFQIKNMERNFDINPDAKGIQGLMDRRWYECWTWCMVYAIK